jgi:hypothetical protein
MKTLAKVFLAASVISLAASLTGPGGEFLWGFLKPLSALLFGAFFITHLLADEYARYDEEQELRRELAQKKERARTPNDEKEPEVGRARFGH